MVKSSSSQSARVARLRKRLSDRDFAVLHVLHRVRLASLRHIQRLLMTDGSPAARTRRAQLLLTRLTKLGLVTRFSRTIGGIRAGSSGYIYGLSGLGQAVLDTDGPLGGRRRRVWESKPYFQDHMLEVAELYVQLVERHWLGQGDLLAYDAEPAAWRHFTGSQNELVMVKPDAYVRIGTAAVEHSSFAYIDQADADARAKGLLRKVLVEEAPAIRDAVVDGFAFAPESLTNVVSDKTLDRIVENTLGIRLGDQELATDAYRDLKEQVIGAKQRQKDAHVSVALTPWKNGSASGEGSMFVATISWESRVTPPNPVLRFSCVSDLDVYRELSADPTSTISWLFPRFNGLDAASPEVFELVQVTVNGKDQRIRRTIRKGGQVFTCTLDDEVGTKDEVTISYTYRVLVQRHGHVLHLDLAQPTEDFRAELWYGDCGIRRMNVIDYLSGPRQPRYRHLDASDPSSSVEVAYEGWTFPKGGVAFVWVLQNELG